MTTAVLEPLTENTMTDLMAARDAARIEWNRFRKLLQRVAEDGKVDPGVLKEVKHALLMTELSPHAAPPMELVVDPARLAFEDATGIFVRARLAEKWASYDIAQLERESLLTWLRSRPNFAEQTVLLLLNHSRDA